jgi:very-short-patch-repair endonuclease
VPVGAARAYDELSLRFIEAEGCVQRGFWNNPALSNTDGVLQTIAQRLSETGDAR